MSKTTRQRKPAASLPADTRLTTPVERQDELDQLELVDRLKNEAGTAAYVRIYRRLSGETEYSRVGKMMLDDYSEDRVEELYGGGDYKVQASTSLHKFVKAWSFKIDSSIPPKHPKARPDAGGPAPEAGSDSVALVKALLEDRTAGAGPGGEGFSTKELFLLMMKQQESADRRFEAMLTKLAGAKSQDESPLMMLLMKSVLEQKHTPLKEMAESMSLFKRMIGGRGGDEDEEEKKEDFLDKLGRVLGPMAASVAEKLLNGEQVTAPPKPALTVGPAAVAAADTPATAPAAVKPPPNGATTIPPMNILVKAAIRDIRAEALKTAAAGGDPLEFAAHVDSMIPDSFADQVEAAANADNWFETFFGDTPEAELHREWLTKVRDELLELLKPEDSPAG